MHKNNDEEDKIQKIRKNCMESLKNAKSRQQKMMLEYDLRMSYKNNDHQFKSAFL